MKILGIDTATRSCSVAIIDGDTVVSEMTLLSKQTHSKHLMDMIVDAVRVADITISEIDGFAVTQGPGSFTGLRIGISTVKGLALGSGKPLVGVSTLDTLASQIPLSPFLICTLLDARKHEVYCCRYRYEGSALKKETSEQALSPESAISDISEPCLFVGDGAELYQNLIRRIAGDQSYFVHPRHHIIRASSAAMLSKTRFETNDTDELASFAPNYIRKSDVELSLGAKIF